MRILWLLVMFVAFRLSGAASVQIPVFHFPRNENVFFKSDHLTGGAYRVFQRDGAYREIAREHMGVWENDSGTWTQADTGELTLVSKSRNRDIVCGPFTVFSPDEEDIAGFPELKSVISRKIARAKAGKVLPPKPGGKFWTNWDGFLPGVLVDGETRFLTIGQLADLSSSIDAFINDSAKNHIRTTPIKYKGRVLLLWNKSDRALNNDLAEMKRNLDGAKHPSYVAFYDVRVDKKTFEKETHTTQPFIVYPEMNKCVPQPAERE